MRPGEHAVQALLADGPVKAEPGGIPRNQRSCWRLVAGTASAVTQPATGRLRAVQEVKHHFGEGGRTFPPLAWFMHRWTPLLSSGSHTTGNSGVAEERANRIWRHQLRLLVRAYLEPFSRLHRVAVFDSGARTLLDQIAG
jgi:hypothetical protein